MSGVSTGLPIDEKIIDDHLAVQAIIRSYQVTKELRWKEKTTKGQSRDEAKLLNSSSVPNPNPTVFPPRFFFFVNAWFQQIRGHFGAFLDPIQIEGPKDLNERLKQETHLGKDRFITQTI